MKKSKAISLLLCLSLLASLLIPGTLAMPAKAAEGGTDNGMVISKTATANTDGTYTIQLEAYATGSKIISDVKKDVPTDIVLVLDQSGSMDDPIGTVTFEPYKDDSYGYDRYHTRNQDYYEVRANGDNPNLYYPLGNGAYASVSVELEQSLTYSEITNGRNNPDYTYFYTSYWGNRNNLYAKVNGEYLKVTVTRTDSYYNATYTYSLPNGTVIASEQGRNGTPTFEGIDGNVLYLASADESQNIYTYTYTDANGNTKPIGSSTGATTVPGFTLYEKVTDTSAGGSRLAALQTAVTNFASAVATKAAGADGNITTTNDNVNHRIAVVGYASRKDSNNPWINTEVFIGANQYNYNVNASSYYGSAFQNMDTTQGQANVAASIGALDANGATYTNYGLEMANGILNANPVETGKKRNRVIILFTDGYPGKNADDFNETAANSALRQAGIAKDNGVSVYSVGIFSGADATSAGNKDGNNTQAANWFMQQVSSNNGTPQTPSYYLSASDAATLNNIFQQISDQIESGGSSTTLSSETVIKDIIADQFTLPEGATARDITLETYSCTGKNSSGYTWQENNDSKGAVATVDGSQVSVTGFNFADNYVGTVTDNGKVSYRGNKLVISFTVTPKADFLGGNNVYTNTSAGVYEDAKAEKAVVTFPRPQVNVPIKEVTVTAADKNVYLLGDLTAEQIKSGATVKCGTVTLDLSKATDTDKPYGLDPWQTEYVDITVTVKDKDGNSISDKLENLTEDTTYTVEVTVSPKTEGTSTPEKGHAATAKTGINDPAANIYVFKPELTFKDSTAYYGESVPTNNDFSSNKVGSETWKHGDTASTDEGVTMLGTKPTLDISYTPVESKLEDGKYTKQDVPVAATVKIGTENVNEHTTFVHQDCTTACGWETPATPGAPAFLIHIQTCQLTITKTGGAADESYVFDVYKDGSKYSEVTIEGNTNQTIYELPVGTYTILENTGWSWRYTPSYDKPNGVTLSASSNGGTITCTNSSNDKIYWLNGFSQVVRNIFGSNN